MNDFVKPYDLGTVVTVISAHPDHGKWFGLIVDRQYITKTEPNFKWYGRLMSRERWKPTRWENWYYLVIGPHFDSASLNTTDDMLFMSMSGNNIIPLKEYLI